MRPAFQGTRPRKIRVNALDPGFIQTLGLPDGGFMHGAMLDRVVARTPVGRLGHPDGIADALVLLASGAPR